MAWLIAARTVQGLGGGAILQIVNIVISDIVALKEYVYPFLLRSTTYHYTHDVKSLIISSTAAQNMEAYSA